MAGNHLHTFRRAAVAAVAGLFAVIIGATPALANGTIAANTPVVTSTPGTYDFFTDLSYWSVVAVRPAAGVDDDLQLLSPSGTMLASSAYGSTNTDFIAINSNYPFQALGGYSAKVVQYSGSGQYALMFWERRQTIPLPTSPIGGISTALALNFAWPVSANQIWMEQGQGFRVNYNPSTTKVFLAGSTPGQPSTGLRTRSALENAYVAADNIPSSNGSVCRVFIAPSTGWYSIITVWTTAYTPPPYNGGAAVFPQRYNPAMGDTLTQCPSPI